MICIACKDDVPFTVWGYCARCRKEMDQWYQQANEAEQADMANEAHIAINTTQEK